MENPLVSILIPVFNREKIIKKCVLSALNQTYKNIEVIVVDNHSYDNTWDILNELVLKYDNLKILQNSENIGPVLNWQKCIELSKGDYLKILWSDDLMHEMFIKEAIPLFLNSNVGFVFTSVVFFNTDDSQLSEKTDYWRKTGLYNSNLYLQSILLGKNNVPVSASCAIFRREAIEYSFKTEVPNNFSLSHKNTGAGIDALMFILTAYKFPLIGYLNKAYSLFSYGYDSITQSEGTNLYKFYYTAYYYFIINFYNQYIGQFKSLIYYQLRCNRKLNVDNYNIMLEIYSDIKVDYDIKHYYYLKFNNYFNFFRKYMNKIIHLIKSRKLLIVIKQKINQK